MSRRLLIVTPSHALHGGVERIIESLAGGLPERGIEVMVGLAKGQRFNDPDRYRSEYPLIRSLDLDGSTGTSAGRRSAIRDALGRSRPDIVLITRISDAFPVVCASKIGGTGPRLAVTIQAFEPEYIHDTALFGDFVDLCVTSGRLVAETTRRVSGIPPERIVSIPGGVRPAGRRVRHRAGPLRLGYVGRLDVEQKRILDLPPTLEALDRLQVPFELLVVGCGPAEATLKGLLQPWVTRSVARVEGWKPVSELYERVYPELDVFLHFSGREGITIAPREAMAHGVVPVVSGFPGSRMEGQFQDGRNCLEFDVGDPGGAATRVQRLDRDRGLLRSLSLEAAASQTGDRSEGGALDAWASAFHRALEQPCRMAGQVPAVATRGKSRLERAGVPPSVAEKLRRLVGRRYEHGDPGSEWPNWSGSAGRDRLEEIRRVGLRLEAEGPEPRMNGR